MKNIKPIARIFALFTLIILTASCSIYRLDDNTEAENTDYKAKENFEFTYKVNQEHIVSLQAVSGTIEIKAEDDLDSVKIWGERICESDSEEDALENLENLRVEIERSNKKIKIETIQPNNSHGRNYKVNYKLIIPKSWQSVISQANGLIDLDSCEEDVIISAANGEIRLDDIKANTSVSLQNGNITADVEIPDSGSCQLSAVNGLINLQIPKETDAAFSAKVVYGAVRCSGLTMTKTASSNNKITGTMGSGDGMIELSAVNGNINVLGKD